MIVQYTIHFKALTQPFLTPVFPSKVREFRRHAMTTLCSFLHFSRSTILVRLKKEKNSELQYKPGDHLAIFPANRPELVQGLIDRLSGDVDPDSPVAVEVLREIKGWSQV